MRKLKNIREYSESIEQNKVQIFQFGTSTCTPCVAIRQKLDLWSEGREGVSCLYVSVEEFPEQASAEGIFSVPAILVYVEGKLTIRECGYFSLEEIFGKIERYMLFL